MELWNNDESNLIKYAELELFPDILPFIISSFQIINDMVKFKYNLSPKLNFNIKKWYVIKNTLGNDKSFSFLENISYDLVIQIIISKHDKNNDIDIGEICVGKHIQYKSDFEYMFVFFIDFSFTYINKSNNKITISLKELTTNMLDNIDI